MNVSAPKKSSFSVFLECLCAHAHVCICYVHKETRSHYWCSSPLSSILIFERVSLTKPNLTNFCRLTVWRVREICQSLSLWAWDYRHESPYLILCWCWDLSLCLHTCTDRTLQTWKYQFLKVSLRFLPYCLLSLQSTSPPQLLNSRIKTVYFYLLRSPHLCAVPVSLVL